MLADSREMLVRDDRELTQGQVDVMTDIYAHWPDSAASPEIKISPRFFLFGMVSYDAAGGMGDYMGSFDSVEEARAAFETSRYEYFDIAILKDGELVDVE